MLWATCTPTAVCGHRISPVSCFADLIVAETIYVLESFYEAPREQVAMSMRSLISMRSVVTVDPALLLRAIEVYEVDRLDFAEAYLVAAAERTGVGVVATFDQTVDRVGTVRRAPA